MNPHSYPVLYMILGQRTLASDWSKITAGKYSDMGVWWTLREAPSHIEPIPLDVPSPAAQLPCKELADLQQSVATLLRAVKKNIGKCRVFFLQPRMVIRQSV